MWRTTLGRFHWTKLSLLPGIPLSTKLSNIIVSMSWQSYLTRYSTLKYSNVFLTRYSICDRAVGWSLSWWQFISFRLSYLTRYSIFRAWIKSKQSVLGIPLDKAMPSHSPKTKLFAEMIETKCCSSCYTPTAEVGSKRTKMWSPYWLFMFSFVSEFRCRFDFFSFLETDLFLQGMVVKDFPLWCNSKALDKINIISKITRLYSQNDNKSAIIKNKDYINKYQPCNFKILI